MKLILEERPDPPEFKTFYCADCDIWFLSNEYMKYYNLYDRTFETKCPKCENLREIKDYVD